MRVREYRGPHRAAARKRLARGACTAARQLALAGDYTRHAPPEGGCHPVKARPRESYAASARVVRCWWGWDQVRRHPQRPACMARSPAWTTAAGPARCHAACSCCTCARPPAQAAQAWEAAARCRRRARALGLSSGAAAATRATGGTSGSGRALWPPGHGSWQAAAEGGRAAVRADGGSNCSKSRQSGRQGASGARRARRLCRRAAGGADRRRRRASPPDNPSSRGREGGTGPRPTEHPQPSPPAMDSPRPPLPLHP